MVNRFTTQLFSLLVAAVPFAEGMAETASKERLYGSYLELGGQYGTSNTSNGNGNLFMPLWQNPDNLLYTNIRGADFNGPAAQGSFGLGYRALLNDTGLIIGGYSFYDLAGNVNNNSYQQVTVGAEAKTLRWSANANGYIPVGPTANRQQNYDQYTFGGLNENGFKTVAVHRGEEKSMGGFDAEVGRELNFILDNLTAYVGGYYYAASNVDTIAGPRARLRYFYDLPFTNVYYRFAVETGAQYDKPRGSEWYVGASMRFGFGNLNKLDGLQKRMIETIYHNQPILVRATQTNLVGVNGANGAPLTIADVTDEASFDNAVTHTADVLAVQNGVTLSDTKTLADGQTLTGGHYEFNNVQVKLSDGGALTAASGKDLLQVGRDNTVRDITLNVDADSGLNAIKNDQTTSFGNLTVDKLITNGLANFTVADKSTDANVSITQSHFNVGNITNSNAINVTATDSTISVGSLSNNTMSFGSKNANQGIYILALDSAANQTSVVNVGNINGNIFSYVDGAGHSAIQISANARKGGSTSSITVDNMMNNDISFVKANTTLNGIAAEAISLQNPLNAAPNSAHVTINHIQSNRMVFAGGPLTTAGLNAGISVLAFGDIGGGGKNTVTLGNVTDNQAIFGNGNSNELLSVSAGISDVTINTIYGNHATFSEGTDNTGFFFDAIDAKVAVNVNHNNQGLSEANNNLTISPDSTGNIIYNPGP